MPSILEVGLQSNRFPQIVHIPTFEAQYSGLKELVEQRRIDEIDPAWLSLYFMVGAARRRGLEMPDMR